MEKGWIIPGAYRGSRITSFRWTAQPSRGAIEATRKPVIDGYIYTIRESEYTVKNGIITSYAKTTKSD